MKRATSSGTVQLISFGCKLNYAETSAIRHQLEEAGFAVAASDQIPDYVIINTCAVTSQAERDARKAIRRVHRLFPSAKIVVTGCYAQLRPEELAEQPGVIAVFGNTAKGQIASFLSSHPEDCTTHLFVSDPDGFYQAATAPEDSRTRAFLKVQDGCDYRCSYCTIPKARGKSRGMAIEEVLQHIEVLEQAGYPEVVLTGINLGDYRDPQNRKFFQLLQAIEAMRPGLRVRISSIEPNLVTESIVSLIAQSSVFCPHFHLPLQSGSPAILRRMRRRYTVETYRQKVSMILEAMPNCAIGVDVIVGFPGETEEHFQQTYEFLESLPVAYLHVFSYSERSGTDAALFPNKVPAEEKKRRSQLLRRLSEQKRQAFAQRFVGQTLEWIPEQYDPQHGGWVGWTENYIRLFVPAPATLAHRRYTVHIHRRRAAQLVGDIAEPLTAPAAVVQLPVVSQ